MVREANGRLERRAKYLAMTGSWPLGGGESKEGVSSSNRGSAMASMASIAS